MQANATVIEQLTQRIVQSVHSLGIILFGSAARGEMGEDSDLDILVVMPDGIHRRKTTQELHFTMLGFPLPVDILVATPTDLIKHKDNIGLIYKTVLEEGREIYAA